jgi:hypothetical protein
MAGLGKVAALRMASWIGERVHIFSSGNIMLTDAVVATDVAVRQDAVDALAKIRSS